MDRNEKQSVMVYTFADTMCSVASQCEGATEGVASNSIEKNWVKIVGLWVRFLLLWVDFALNCVNCRHSA